MAWLYDHADGDVPRIAALPAWNEINFFNGKHWLNDARLDTSVFRSYRQSLDMYNGLIQTTYQWMDEERGATIILDAFVSRANQNLGVIKVQIIPHYSGQVKLSFPIRAWKPPKRLNLARIEKLEPDSSGQMPSLWSVWHPGYMIVNERNVEREPNGGRLSMIAQAVGSSASVAEVATIMLPAKLQNLTLSQVVLADYVSLDISFHAQAEESYTFQKYVGIVSSLETSSPVESAMRTAQIASARGYTSILQDHVDAWHRLWQTDIIVDGDPEFQKVIHSMIFYLLCSVREGTEFSIPPMGLSSAGYYGHIFWDADTWILPALLVMHPAIAKSLVMFRYRTLEAAKRNAQLNGYQGAMYPWEADEMGNETTPKFAYQNALYEIHVTGDVALAQWQYYLAAGDQQWLAKYGYPVMKETADFWTSRVTYNESKDRYDIKNVVSVDEGLIGIHNDAYTNTIAKKNLEIAVVASKVLGREQNPLWEKISSKLYIPYDAQQEFHPTYEDAPSATLGSAVPLLSYPLSLQMSEQTKKNNLNNAVKRIVEKGPGGMMSITFYPIVAAELGDVTLLNDLFPESYKPYLKTPFNVLAETPASDAINFLTGAGGFLQQVIYGYAGLRLDTDGLVQKFKPFLPNHVERLTLKNFRVRDKGYDIVIEKNNVRFIEK